MNTEMFFQFFKTMAQVKDIERYRGMTYWVSYPFPDRYDSVPDHSWRLQMIIWRVTPHLSQPIDLLLAFKYCLLHDIPELMAGDACPHGES